MSRWIGLHGAAILLGVLLVGLTVKPPVRGPPKDSDLVPVLLRPAVARTLSKPFLPMLVELYWLRSLNSIGEADSARKNRALYDYGRVLTDLDPRFRQAYTYLGINIPYRAGRNRWENGALAVDLLQRGVDRFPEDLQMHLYLGFTLFEIERRFRDASAVFGRLARLPGAPSWAPLLATRLLAHDGNAREGLALAQALLQATAPDDELRPELEERVELLRVEVLLQDVDHAAARFAEREGRPPKSLDELVAAGDHPGPTVDAMGGTVSLDPEGKATSTSLTRRLVLFERN